MSFDYATLSFHSKMTAACSQFKIKESNIQMSLYGSSRYAFLNLDAEQTQNINQLAKKVGINHEKGPGRNKFMVYSGTFCPSQVKLADPSCEATAEEKKVFGEIFDIASKSIATQMGLSVRPEDVEKITLQKTVDFSFIEAQRACTFSIELSLSAADRLGIPNETTWFRNMSNQSKKNEIAMEIYPGQL